MKLLAVTACPSGVAHTYMSAEALQIACEKANVEIKVETQGSIGRENIITKDDVQQCDAVILTKDMPIIEEERFEGKPVLKVGVSQAIKQADAIIAGIQKKLNA